MHCIYVEHVKRWLLHDSALEDKHLFNSEGTLVHVPEGAKCCVFWLLKVRLSFKKDILSCLVPVTSN